MMDRSDNPDALIRERVEYIEPDPNGIHTYVWRYDTKWLGNFGKTIRAYQIDIDLGTVPPTIDAIHFDLTQSVECPDIPATVPEIERMARLIGEDFGPEAIGLSALREYLSKAA